MITCPRRVSRRAMLALPLVAALGLAACAPVATPARGPAPDAGAPVAVALLVPAGSGGAGDQILAQALENAARLAIADLGALRIDLRVYGTGGQPAGAEAAALRAAEDGARIILGPVFAAEAAAAGVAVAGRGINVLSFSNNADIAGGNIFVLGSTFQNTANRLIGYAARQGQRRVMIVHDRTAAGEIGRAAAERAVAAQGATLAGVASYEFSQEGVVQAIPAIVAQIRASGADAILFTADTAGALPLLTQLLRDNGVTPETARFLGLTRWDIPPGTLSLPGLQGGWFALPDPAVHAQFEARYAAAFGAPPHPIAGLAYDGIAAIGALVQQGRTDALGRAALTQAAGFAGVNGVFRLRPDGSSERGLAVAEVRNGQVVVIDPAPRSFVGVGF
jgi:ABC-type branched-subunit amino acid transport system substrate-binding protein